MLANQETIIAVEGGSEEVAGQVELIRKEMTIMRDEELVLQEGIQKDFSREFGAFWEFAQAEMAENRNEEFALSREVTKLSNEIKALQTQIEAAEGQIRGLERETGVRGQ
jgi:hypothetical protein